MIPFSPEECDELAAGYVLGDLTSEEAVLFQQRLQADKALQLRVNQLQETLGMMALGVPSQQAPPELRSRIMQAVETRLDLMPDITSELTPADAIFSAAPQASNQAALNYDRPFAWNSFGRQWLWWSSGVVLLAGILFSQQYRLKQQMAMLQTAFSQYETLYETDLESNTDPRPTAEAAPEKNSSNETTLTMEAPAALVAEQWPGLQHLSQDHQQLSVGSTHSSPLMSEANPQANPQENPQANSQALDSETTPEHLTPSPTMLRLVEQSGDRKAQFVTVTPCQMGQTEGLRMTYLLDQKTAVSVYKLQRGKEFPHPGKEAMSLQSAEGLSMILWEEDRSLYAIVSDLPMIRLKQLAIAS